MKLNMPVGKVQPDPYVLKEGNRYYMYATHKEGVQLYVSENRADWSYVGFCFRRAGFMEFWAPAVIRLDGKYYLYVSCMPEEAQSEHSQRLVAAEAAAPAGPFAFRSEIADAFSIDAHAVESGGGLFLFYSVNDYEAARPGTLIVVDRMRSPVQAYGSPKVVVRPTLDEDIFMRSRFEKGKDWHTVEGACYFRKGDWHYLTYSGNCYKSEYYYIGYARAHSAESDLTKLDFRKYPADDAYAPLLCKNASENGTGHNSILEEDGRYFLFYHGRDGGENGERENRTARICEISAEDGVLKVIAR